MQAQAYEGYIENGHVYPLRKNIPVAGRKRVLIAIPVELENEVDINDEVFYIEYKHLPKDEDMKRRLAWLDRLDNAMALAHDEELIYTPRSNEMREPINLID